MLALLLFVYRLWKKSWCHITCRRSNLYKLRSSLIHRPLTEMELLWKFL